ncbi:MAG: class I SAM-dependent methyltransferase [Solirubrobacteraceae bacterium]
MQTEPRDEAPALPPPSQRVVAIFEHIARSGGSPLRPGADVLDFGAGAGRHVAEFRAAGYEAVGADQQFSSHEAGSAPSRYLHRVEPPDYVLPFDDGSFDLVFSTSVMEHVVEPGRALAQIARVLRPDGLSIHCFPSRWRPVEPHMHTPFGGRFNTYALCALWARLGIRNGHQRGLPAREVALRNAQYAQTAISYPTAREWRRRSEPLFADVRWSETAYVEATRAVSGLSRLIAPALPVPGVQWLYRGLHTRVLVLGRPR